MICREGLVDMLSRSLPTSTILWYVTEKGKYRTVTGGASSSLLFVIWSKNYTWFCSNEEDFVTKNRIKREETEMKAHLDNWIILFHSAFIICRLLPGHVNPDTNTCLAEGGRRASVLRNYENCRAGTKQWQNSKWKYPLSPSALQEPPDVFCSRLKSNNAQSTFLWYQRKAPNKEQDCHFCSKNKSSTFKKPPEFVLLCILCNHWSTSSARRKILSDHRTKNTHNKGVNNQVCVLLL